MRKGSFTWLKRNSVWLLLAIYTALHFAFLEFHPFIVFKTGLFVSMTLMANLVPEKRMASFSRLFLYLAFGISVFLLDELMISDLSEHLRMRFLLPATMVMTAFIVTRTSLSRMWNTFLGLNVIFLSISVAWSWNQALEFKIQKTPSNALFDSLSSALSKGQPVTLVLADGYPSKRILEERFGIPMGLDTVLKDYTYRDLQSRYTSTPVSVANLLFGAEFSNNEIKFGIRGRRTEVDLLAQAMDGSLLDSMLAGREKIWSSFIMDDRYNRMFHLPFWDREHFRALFGKLFLSKFNDRRPMNWEIEKYNAQILSDYGRTMRGKDADSSFVFLHLLTYHRWDRSMREEVAYADSLILEAVRATPGTRKLILFSDHGHRGEGMTAEDMRAGVLLTSPLP